MAGELLDVVLREGADHQAVEVAREHRRGVAQRLAAAELQVRRGQVEPVAAELRDPDLERDARPGRGLLKDHPERPAGKELVLLATLLALLEVVGEVENAQQLLAAPVRNSREVPALQAFGDDRHCG